MLYITTRENHDAHTAARTLSMDRAADGGCFVPFRLPVLSETEISGLGQKGFGQNVADTLNLFFSARLSGWDVEFAIGRNPVKLAPMNHRLVIAELWNNPQRSYAYLERKLSACLPYHKDEQLTEWVTVAIRIAVVFGLFGELIQAGFHVKAQQIDIAVPAKDFLVPIACWYAREMGLPIGNIICGCDGESGLWDLICRGEYNTAAMRQIPPGLERLIQGTLGCQEVKRFLSCSEKRRVYAVAEEAHDRLRRGLFAAVVGKARVDSIINSAVKSSTYVLEPSTALSYGALQDYRTGNSESRVALLLSDNASSSGA